MIEAIRALRDRIVGGTILVLAAASACGLPLNESLDTSVNTCVDENECSADERCASRTGSSSTVCVAGSVRLGTVVFQVQSPDVSYVFDANETPEQGQLLAGEIPAELNLTIRRPVAFVGSMRVDGDTTGCAALDGTIPARAELRSVVPYATLSTTYVTQLDEPIPGDATSGYRFVAKVPPGSYDVYVKPDLSRSGCASVNASPRYFGSVDLRYDTTFSVPQDAPRTLSGTVVVSTSGAPSGWQMDLVEPRYGLPVSSTAVLGEPDGSGQVSFTLSYAYHEGMLLRLRRPDDQLTIHWETSGFTDPDHPQLDLTSLSSLPLHKEASTLRSDNVPLRARVVIQSQQLGAIGAGASFRIVTESGDDGKLSVDLLPGTYQVSVAPVADPGLATLREEWEVAPGFCCGKTFVLPPKAPLSGTVVRGQNDASFGFTSIVAEAPLEAPSKKAYFDQERSAQSLLPQQGSTVADASGNFVLLADPGSLNVTVRTNPDSSYPWLVVPTYLVESARSMGKLRLRGPVVLPGKVAVEGTTGLGGARIRAYALVDAPDFLCNSYRKDTSRYF